MELINIIVIISITLVIFLLVFSIQQIVKKRSIFSDKDIIITNNKILNNEKEVNLKDVFEYDVATDSLLHLGETFDFLFNNQKKNTIECERVEIK